MRDRNVVFFPIARSDIRGITDYIALDNPHAAWRFRGAVTATIQNLLIIPRGFPVFQTYSGSSEGIRAAPISKFPRYLLFYSADTPGQLQIIRVLHSAQNWQRELDSAA